MRDQLEHLSRALVNQLLHGPSSRLRAAAGSEQGREYARMVRDLWDLAEPDVPPAT
jgi:glutamyl-tRNA reductase